MNVEQDSGPARLRQDTGPEWVATVVEGPSALCVAAAVAELTELGCQVTDVQSSCGRVFFRAYCGKRFLES